MAWDESKHKVIKRVKVKHEDGIYLELFSYDKGPKKIGFRQEIETKSGDKKMVTFSNPTPEQALNIGRALVKFSKDFLGIS